MSLNRQLQGRLTVARRNNSHRYELPSVSPVFVNLFVRYIRRYLKRSFHALRLSRQGQVPLIPDGPLLIYLNHPSWWDPLVCLFLAYHLFPDHTHYGPIDADALGRYRIFSRLGFFGVTPGTTRGAATFLRTSQAIFQHPKTAIWITPEGQFSDPRQRPVQLQPGISYLARRLDQGRFVPLAIEYPFWQERFPEILVRFGDAIHIGTSRDQTVAAYSALLASNLANTQEALAREACQQDPSAFEVLLWGRAGIGGVYDTWRSWRARLRGDAFRKSHGIDE